MKRSALSLVRGRYGQVRKTALPEKLN